MAISDLLMQSTKGIDIEIMIYVKKLVESIPGSHFVLTGSYAMEALTRKAIRHNDIDCKVFARDVGSAVAALATLLRVSKASSFKVAIYKISESRLECNISKVGRHSKDTGGPRAVEAQFVKGKKTHRRGVLGFKVDTLGSSYFVPVKRAYLKGSGFILKFYTQTLEYVLASWIIRLSGQATNPKRPVLERDKINLKRLLCTKYRPAIVLRYMRGHPQMPKGVSVQSLFRKVLQQVDITAGNSAKAVIARVNVSHTVK